VALAGVLLVASSGSARATPRGWSLPPGAREVAPDVFEIGSRDVGGRTLTGLAIVHRAPNAKGGGGHGGGGKSVGYAYLSNGMKWKVNESYVVDPTNEYVDDTLSDDSILDVMDYAVDKWEAAAGAAVMTPGSLDTFDHSSIGVTYNDVNEICFDAIAEQGVIAVTFVWGYYSGPPQSREIIEWDQIYDDDGSFHWSNVSSSGDTSAMDFDNIATHEVGHAFGMDHPGSSYTEETMYAYASPGETTKRDLNAGDIAGIDNLY
jgi:hypothetical protein